MPTDIKGILDSIIDGANNKFPNNMNTTLHQNPGTPQPVTIDSGKFREKLSLYVLKDLICAMMHDDTKDLDSMIDQSIMTHIHDTYGCTCYDYLCRSCNKLNSPVLSDIIQEIDDKTMRIQSKVVDRQDDSSTADAEDLKESLKNIDNYEELRQKLKEVVSKKVVDDVAKVVTTSNDAPVFDDLDEKLAEKKESPQPTDEMTNESVILRMCGNIVTEAAMNGVQMDSHEGPERAIIQYCISEMDYLFKMDPSMRHIQKYCN